jgi:hypothetical protein
MSWKPEVKTIEDGSWFGNGLRFATEAEAIGNVKALKRRWLLVTETRAVESEEPVNYKWADGKLEPTL